MAELIGFVGGGQMAGSLIGGLLAAGHPAARIRVAEPDAGRADFLRQTFGVEVKDRGADIAQDCDALVLAVKPQTMREALRGLRAGPETPVLSIAAGLRIETLRAWLGGNATVVRAMPNTPALLRQGIAGLYAAPGTAPDARALSERIMKAVGEICWVEREELLDAVTALSGSGPAYYFLLTEVLREAGCELGLNTDTARRLAEKTFIGAARMAEGGQDVVELRSNVTSRGGTTEAAVAHLENAGLRRLFADALRAATRRARELGEALAKT